MSDNKDVWVIIPVYNEEKVIAQVVRELIAVFPHVVCVDDGSRDASASEVAGTGAHLVRHPVNLGQGAALQTGIEYALARRGSRYFVTFDADGQHRVADAARMLQVARVGDVDAVLGSRFLERTATVPLAKRMVLRAAALLSRSGRRLRLTDSHNGLRVFTRPVAEQLKIKMNGMAHASEIVANLAHGNWRVVEVPVTILYTDYSRSKGQSLVNGVNILLDLSLRDRRR